MSAQLRYRTLSRNIGQIYASPKEGRTSLLQSGLDEIVTVINPGNAASWNVVGADSERLLKVWVAKEADPAAEEVANQLTDLLWELSMEDTKPSASASASASSAFMHYPSPALHVLEPPSLAFAALNLSSQDNIKHVILAEEDTDDEVEVEVEAASESEESEMEVEVEEEEEEEPPKPVEPPKPAAKPVEPPKPAAKPVEPPKPAVAVAVAEEEEEEIVEEEEEAAEEDEEAGMEVERIFVRGRPYWLETNTKKIYAIEGDDDVGDEVGVMEAGKPRFYAK